MASTITSEPWLVVELKNYKPRISGDWVYQLKQYLQALDCRKGVILSPKLFITVVEDEITEYELQRIDIEDARTILRSFDKSFQPAPIEKRDYGQVVQLIKAVECAQANDAKGKTLETLARFLFEDIPSLRCKYANLYTRSSEIDLVIEYDQSKGRLALFDELGRYCLVECKNWSKAVGVGPVRDFMGKLDKCKVQFGVILSKNGVTGVDSGADALREIQSRFDHDGVLVLVFSLEELRLIKSSNEFYAALDSKADRLRFDAAG